METKHVNKHDGTTPQKPCAPPNSTSQDTARICGMLGLCVKAGKAVLGAPLVLQAIRSMQLRRRPQMVFLCSDASANTCKRIQNGCRTYHVPCYMLPLTGTQTAQAVGKSSMIMAVGITDSGMARTLYEKVFSENPDTPIS